MRQPWALAISIGLAACLPEASAPGNDRPIGGGCYQSFAPTGDASLDLAKLTDACGGGLVPVTPVITSEPHGERDAPETFSFRARKGRCYRVFAAGDGSVRDLDLAVYDPEGRLAAADVGRDRFPVAPPRSAICAQNAGVYTLAASVARGRGSYVLQVWGSGDRVFDLQRDP